MQHIPEFLQNEVVVALLTSTIIFFITILLVAKNWISFWTTFLLLLFAIAAGFVIGHYHTFQSYLEYQTQSSNLSQEANPETFKSQISQAMEHLQKEVHTEKENLHKLMVQVDEIFDQMNTQKQKLEHFIEVTQERFKAEDQKRAKRLNEKAKLSEPAN